ncbi:MAG: hypothetical protein DSY43_00315 [Gammaproteobacteria bacterium]|nr:MAG: hypothetical protein DSY43_00315 [Gammaproteobacteria bacterium]
MPAAPHGRDNQPPIYLTTNESKLNVYHVYVKCCNACTPVVPHVGLTLFKSVWSSCVPHIRLMEPRTDVCNKCDQFRKLILDSVTEEDKLTHTQAYNTHVHKARLERQCYNDCIKASCNELRSVEVPAGPQQPCSNNLQQTHYTFDFAMSFNLPHQCLQVGPLYFLNLLKVHCFGICCEGVKKQVNFLFTERDCLAMDGRGCHGPNNVISMLDFYLFHNGMGERRAVFHADNCGGQNKNKSVLHYFCWRVGKGLHTEISYNFMEPGHTKCICDACFGKIRQLFRRTDVNTTNQLRDTIQRSALINDCIVYREGIGREFNFKWYGWDVFFYQFCKLLKGIRKFHHFRFTGRDPGYVYAKEHVQDTQETRICLLKKGVSWPPPQINDHPEEIPAGGIGPEREKYLNDHVKPFVRSKYRDEFY